MTATETARDSSIVPFAANYLWTKTYPITYAGCRFYSRTTFIRLADRRLIVHSPCPIDADLKLQIEALGPVAFIVAPGSYHYLHVADWQAAFPEAETLICPGVERKRPELDFDWLLGDRPPEGWADELDQVLVRGNRLIWEVAFLHRPTKTLILTDLVENIGDQTEGTNWVLRFWWKAVMHMWNKPKPAPEYQLGWKDKKIARRCLERILEWDFERVILSHGDLIEHDAERVIREAWAVPLSFEAS